MGWGSDTMDHSANRCRRESRFAIGRANGDLPSGDCARVFLRREGGALCFLGDVSGHDASAARLARELEARVSAIADWMAPGALLSRVNAELEAVWPPDLFVSAVCFSFHSRTGRGTIALAGQLPPVVKSRWSASVLDVTAGPPLGVLAGERYPENEFGLGLGELLVAVTDGIADPLASDVDLLGMMALARLIERTPADPDEVCASLLRAAGRSGLRDDATVLAIAPVQRQIAASRFMRPALQHLAV
jgi:serine phosphatase RsbU (regulator of sigma subunit)